MSTSSIQTRAGMPAASAVTSMVSIVCSLSPRSPGVPGSAAACRQLSRSADLVAELLDLPDLGHGERHGLRAVLGCRGAGPFVEVGDQLLVAPLLVPAGAADHVGPATAAGLLAVADQLADQLNVRPGDRDSELAGALG